MHAETNSQHLGPAFNRARNSDSTGRLVIVCDSELENSPDGAGFWSNAMGWVSLEEADRFTAHERDTLRLPMGGSWTTEEGLLANPIFHVVGKALDGRWDSREFATADEMEAAGFVRQDRVGGDHLREELVGKPCFVSLCGPMWGGYRRGKPVIRYETWPAYDILSR